MANPFRRTKAENLDNTGFGANSGVEGGRLTNKDGSVNLIKTGMAFWKKISLYHTLIRMSRWKFLACIFLFYTFVNVVFALMYVSIGVDNLNGLHADNDMLSKFQEAYFFSSQTLTTVGYGHISPVGLITNVVASLESFMGILSFAVVTGLLYGRFTRPKAFILFSPNALIAPHRGQTALMMRVATYKNNHLTDVDAQATIALHIAENGSTVTRFYGLKLEINRINSLALSWTLVHFIDENSPLHLMEEKDLREAQPEIMLMLKGFDDHFSNTVQQRSSYTASEIIFGAKFLPAFRRSEDGGMTILELDKIGDFERIELPKPQLSGIND
jgi:inward rectifier potassium channel